MQKKVKKKNPPVSVPEISGRSVSESNHKHQVQLATQLLLSLKKKKNRITTMINK